jgi:hypothetical protein
MVLSFYELPSEDRPPKRIWNDGERLDWWWAEVKKRHDARMRGEEREIEDPVDNAFKLVVD